ncbi:MAG: hypothetical protein RLZZ262_1024 [Bacteroidota bacterium]
MIGDFSRAMKDSNRIVELVPDSPEFWNLKGNMHLLYAEYAEAIECHNRTVGLKPEYAESFYNRGLAHMMSYVVLQGCADLDESCHLGYERAGIAKLNFCGN